MGGRGGLEEDGTPDHGKGEAAVKVHVRDGFPDLLI